MDKFPLFFCNPVELPSWLKLDQILIKSFYDKVQYKMKKVVFQRTNKELCNPKCGLDNDSTTLIFQISPYITQLMILT